LSEKSCNPTYEPLIRDLALKYLSLPDCRLIAIPTYPDTIVYEIATDTSAFIFKSIDPQTRDPDGIAAEAWVLNHRKAQGVPVPQVLFADASKQIFPSAYFIMEKAKGQPLSSLALKSEEKQPYFCQLGEALRRLHSVELPGFGWLNRGRFVDYIHHGNRLCSIWCQRASTTSLRRTFSHPRMSQ
jgi:hypothetical protein